jgi:hypothetical protein
VTRQPSSSRPSDDDTEAPRGACDGCGRVVALAELDGPGPLICACCGGLRDRRGVHRPQQLQPPPAPNLFKSPAACGRGPASRGRGPLRR